jgi:hypothetical protein
MSVNGTAVSTITRSGLAGMFLKMTAVSVAA